MPARESERSDHLLLAPRRGIVGRVIAGGSFPQALWGEHSESGRRGHMKGGAALPPAQELQPSGGGLHGGGCWAQCGAGTGKCTPLRVVNTRGELALPPAQGVTTIVHWTGMASVL